MPYLTLDAYKNDSVLDTNRIDALETRHPGWVARQLETMSRWMDARLSKRYAVPFNEADPPAIVQAWLARLVDVRAMLRMGVDQTDEQFQEIRDEAAEVRRQLEEAANSDTGLFELPLRASTSASGVSRGGPLVYSEASPYVHLDSQESSGRREDRYGGGTDG